MENLQSMADVNNGDYGSSNYTSLKNEHFRLLVQMHTRIVHEVFLNQRWSDAVYRYFDLTAGPGLLPAGKQAPLIFLEAAETAGLKVNAHFIERHPETWNLLRAAIPEQDNLFLHQADSLIAFPEAILFSMPIDRPSYYGLVYFDPKPQWKAFELAKLIAEYICHQQRLRHIDVLLHWSATHQKRWRKFLEGKLLQPFQLQARNGETREQRDYCDLKELLSLFGKKVWFVRKPHEQEQWTFLFGTNWKDAKEYKKAELYSVDSDYGRSILNRLNHTAGELASINQGYLPGLEPR